MIRDRLPAWVAICLLLMTAVSWSSASAAMLDDDEDEIPANTSVEVGYQAGVRAHEAEDWQSVIDHLSKVISADPKHDDAHSLLGFAHRKLGDYDRSLSFYNRALQLNPWHRGALEYLGEAYLELDQPERAKTLLERLGDACKRELGAGATTAVLETDCEEWGDLNAAYQAYLDGSPTEPVATE